MMRAAAIGLALVMTQPAFAQEAGADLGPLLAGFERCHANAALKALEESLNKRYANDFGAKQARNDTRINITVPASVQSALGPIRSTLKRDYTDVLVPLSGQFMGFKVRGVSFRFGNENGIGARSLLLEAPLESVKARFAKGLAAAQKEASAEVAVTFKVEAGASPAILCDFSN